MRLWPLRDRAMRRAALLTGAIIALTLAAALLLKVGLPQRATYTGFITNGSTRVAPELNAPAPPFANSTLDGKIVSLDDLRGTPVIINFWATWCVPCRVEMPELQRLYEDYEERGLRILAVNLGESPDVIEPWVREMGLTFDIVLDPEQNVAAMYRLRGQPSTFVISPEGIIDHISYGPVTMETLRAQIGAYF